MINTTITRPAETTFPILFEMTDETIEQDGQTDIYERDYVQAENPEDDQIIRGRPVCAGPADEWQPTHTPDGRVAFFSDRDGGSAVYVGKAGQKRPSVLLDRDDVMEFRFSPDGKQMAFVTVDDQGCNEQLWLAPPDGSEARSVRLGELLPEDIQYSPDGRSLLFCSDVYGAKDANGLYVLDLENLQPAQLTKGSLWTPCFSSDGKSVAFIRRGTKKNKVVRLVSTPARRRP